ncbi:hypothetical protein N7462_006652 [Penicillium macrosclerotiorum]|uniref:uncharacterized protein n=1 Tax=Penicillium macrosclerotiorum TaxID=303699 RepID=UPI002547EACB|nr:uncharacterized protein N7462_006652 [Penicillium macrosclerotiorum]KAJ5683487.1 hypothetical protein N7462_006652 [Penicillium macrosclerotiorum]
MVVFDNMSNGYRNILLPLACEDKLLREAIVVVATQHIALSDPSHQRFAEESRAAIISHLCQESLQMSTDRVFTLSNWATLIVLLVGETITGSAEYSHLLQTMICLSQNIDGMTPSAERLFLTKQTQMFKFLGQPLLGERQGVNALCLPLEQFLDWTYCELPVDSEHTELLYLYRTAFIKASHIYLGRVASDQDQWKSLEDLKSLISRISPDQVGSHSLVWVCFIAAADSTDPYHRKFFFDWMSRIFIKTKFQNVFSGMQALPAIWSYKGPGRWTNHLNELAPSLIIDLNVDGSLSQDALLEDLQSPAPPLCSDAELRSVFTHTDIAPRNIIIDEQSRITGLLDWEYAGWYSDYWEYAQIMRPAFAGDWSRWMEKTAPQRWDLVGINTARKVFLKYWAIHCIIPTDIQWDIVRISSALTS